MMNRKNLRSMNVQVAIEDILVALRFFCFSLIDKKN